MGGTKTKERSSSSSSSPPPSDVWQYEKHLCAVRQSNTSALSVDAGSSPLSSWSPAAGATNKVTVPCRVPSPTLQCRLCPQGGGRVSSGWMAIQLWERLVASRHSLFSPLCCVGGQTSLYSSFLRRRLFFFSSFLLLLLPCGFSVFFCLFFFAVVFHSLRPSEEVFLKDSH